MTDKIKMLAAAILLIAGIAGYYYLSEGAAIVRILSVLAGVIAAVAVMWQTQPGKHFFVFAQDSVQEAKKVVWPSRKETVQTTGIVFLFVIVMAIFLWLVDAGLMWAVKMLMGRSDT
ncbi:MAG: preprotein translocase subunit SecE [Sulfuriferula sp.]|jgi:preprotein translocase subunit SecE|nr:preprotein translocase subunit SecE [Sulfuriferula sp.]